VRLLLRQGSRFAPNHDALPQLAKLRQVQLLFELRLSGQHDLQKLFRRSLQVGQQSDFFKHGEREVLRLVKNQDCGFARAESLRKPLIQFHQLLTLGARLAWYLKFCENKVEQLRRVHPRVE